MAHLAGTLDEIRASFADQITVDESVAFDESTRAIEARRRERLGEIVLRETSFTNPDASLIRTALVDAVRRAGVAKLPWSDGARRLRERIAFVARHDGGWPDLSDAGLSATLDEWLEPRLEGIRSFADLARVDLSDALLGMLDWRHRARLDELAPTHLTVPSGSRVPVDYSDPESPMISVRLQ